MAYAELEEAYRKERAAHGWTTCQVRPNREVSTLSLGPPEASQPELEDGTCFSARWWANLY